LTFKNRFIIPASPKASVWYDETRQEQQLLGAQLLRPRDHPVGTETEIHPALNTIQVFNKDTSLEDGKTGVELQHWRSESFFEVVSLLI